jgi:hypothetical protein
MTKICLALLLATSLCAQTSILLSPSAVPQTGTFFSVQNRPPSPFDWLL